MKEEILKLAVAFAQANPIRAEKVEITEARHGQNIAIMAINAYEQIEKYVASRKEESPPVKANFCEGDCKACREGRGEHFIVSPIDKP